MSKTLSIGFDLARGERLLWSGMPRQGLMLRQADSYMIPFSLFWIAVSVQWERVAIRQSAGSPFPAFPLFGIPFLCIGLYMVIGRFFYDSWRRAHTAYGVTTQRVLIATRAPGSSLTSLDLSGLPTMVLTEEANSRGSIAFGQPALPWGRNARWSGAPSVPTFESIPDAKGVYDQIRAARDAVRGAPTA